jgi:hypothetical protein
LGVAGIEVVRVHFVDLEEQGMYSLEAGNPEMPVAEEEIREKLMEEEIQERPVVEEGSQ